jgi:hypothetical protein
VLPPRLHVMIHHRDLVGFGHDLHGGLRPYHAVPPLRAKLHVR